MRGAGTSRHPHEKRATFIRSEYLRQEHLRKTLDACALVIIGALNWGLVAIAEFDLVAAICGMDFGETNAASRIIYGVVGLAAIYQVIRLPIFIKGSHAPAAHETRA